jgi:hypothetical protein
MSDGEDSTVDRATEMVLAIAERVASLGGNGPSFLRSIDALDHIPLEDIRALTWKLGDLVLGDAEMEERAYVALVLACGADPWAQAEVAGRFRSYLRRSAVLRALARHPRREKFSTLTRAIARGRFTQAQWTLAKKLAAEVTGA